MKKKIKKCQNDRHPDFTRGHPPNYYSSLNTFNFPDRQRGCSGVSMNDHVQVNLCLNRKHSTRIDVNVLPIINYKEIF